MIDVSIIVPVYNTEKYLAECINSLLNQGLVNFEIIIINDGSTDSSEKIIKKYAKKYNQIKYHTQTNKGLGAARNLGLKYAKGEYVYFMDSDDVLEQNSLSYLWRYAEENKLDTLFFDAKSFYDDEFTNHEVNMDYDRGYDYGYFESGEILFNKFIENNTFYSSACLQFTNRNFLNTHSLSFIEGYLHEDELFTVEVLLNAEKSAHLNKKFFKRRLRPNSIMTSNNYNDRVIGYSAILSKYNNLIKQTDFKYESTQTSLIFKMRELYNGILTFAGYINVSPPKCALDIAKENKYFGFKGFMITYFRPIYLLLFKIKAKFKSN